MPLFAVEFVQRSTFAQHATVVLSLEVSVPHDLLVGVVDDPHLGVEQVLVQLVAEERTLGVHLLIFDRVRVTVGQFQAVDHLISVPPVSTRRDDQTSSVRVHFLSQRTLLSEARITSK